MDKLNYVTTLYQSQLSETLSFGDDSKKKLLNMCAIKSEEWIISYKLHMCN